MSSARVLSSASICSLLLAHLLNHLSTPSAIPSPDSTYFLEIVNKTQRFTLSAVLYRRRRWSYSNETLISHALQSALHNTRCCNGLSLSLSSFSLPFASSLASVFFRLASILGNLEVRRLLPRHVALLNASAPVNCENGLACSDYAFLNARAR